jgi:hypothetical protein
VLSFQIAPLQSGGGGGGVDSLFSTVGRSGRGGGESTQREEIDDDDDLPGPDQFVASAGAQRSWFGLASPLPANKGGSGDGAGATTQTTRKHQIIEDDGDDDSSGSLPGPDAFLASASAQRSWMVGRRANIARHVIHMCSYSRYLSKMISEDVSCNICQVLASSRHQHAFRIVIS